MKIPVPDRGMNLAALVESARVGADALRTNPMRTALSTTGVIIGVAALVAAFSITDGVDVWSRALIARESSVQDVTVTPITVETIKGRSYPVRGYPVLDSEDAERASAEIPGVLKHALTLTGTSPVEFLDMRAAAQLTLSTAGLADFAGLNLAGGRFYTEAEVAHAAPVIVLGSRLAQELAGTRHELWLLGRSSALAPIVARWLEFLHLRSEARKQTSSRSPPSVARVNCSNRPGNRAWPRFG